MPSQIIHALGGRQSLARCDVQLDHLAPDIFSLGCQGPDIFSHNRRTKPFAIAFARLLHRHDYGRFCANFARLLADGCGRTGAAGQSSDSEPKSRPGPRSGPLVAAESWFYGFVTHQVVDRIFHPYIVYRSYTAGPTGIPGVPPERFHVFLERILDAYLYEYLEGFDVSSFDAERGIRLGEADEQPLAELVARALSETYPAEPDGDGELELRVRNAFADTLYFYRMTNPAEIGMAKPPDSLRRDVFLKFGIGGAALLHPVGVTADIDWLNLSKTPWRDPVTGTESSLSVPQLFDRAVEGAMASIASAAAVLSGKAAPETLETAFGNGSLSLSGEDGRIGTVRYAAPFDLGPALLEQAEKRKIWLSSSAC